MNDRLFDYVEEPTNSAMAYGELKVDDQYVQPNIRGSFKTNAYGWDVDCKTYWQCFNLMSLSPPVAC